MAERKNNSSNNKTTKTIKTTKANTTNKSKTTKKNVEEDNFPKTTKNIKEKSNKNNENEKNQLWSIILFVVGIIVLLMTIIEGSAGWKAIHNFLLGIFGVAVFAVPIILIYTSLLIGKEKSQKCVTYRAFWGIALTILSGSIIQLYFIGEFEGDGFFNVIKTLYENGKHLKGGGVSSIIFAGILLQIFGVVGARIIVAAIACIFIMMLANISLFQFFNYISLPFIALVKGIIGLSKVLKGASWENAFDEDEDDDDDEDDEFVPQIQKRKSKDNDIFDDEEFDNKILNKSNKNLDIINTEEVQSPKPEISKKAKRKNADDFGLDVPIQPLDNKQIAMNNPINADNKVMSDESCDDLSTLINNAAVNKKAVEMERSEENFSFEMEETPEYQKPSLDLLTILYSNDNAEKAVIEMQEKAEIIVDTLKSFGVAVRISDVFRGPSITRYEIQPGAGVKVSRIKGLEDDIALYLAAQGVRIEAPVPGKACVGIEVPNETKDTVFLREILASKEFRESESKLTFAVGKDIAGNIVLGDIAKMPHVIIAGTTGSGKSVCTRSIIMSILYNSTPEEVRIILIDPKIVEFKIFEGIPQMLIPVVTDPKKAAGALNWAVNEMLRRYNIFAEDGVNDIKSYNALAEKNPEIQKIPQVVIFIDELADLMLVAGKDVEDSICRLAQMGRASGMHLVIATQRPTTDVITGLIKANIPSRIALSVKSQIDSRTIIDMGGADKLLGNGDMLYSPIGASKPVRVQGCFASSSDIEKTVEFVKTQMNGEYDSTIMEAVESFVPETKDKNGMTSENNVTSGSDEDFIEQAIGVAVENGQLSTSMLQRKLKLGYARAARIMDELEDMGVVGASEGAKPRRVLMSRMQYDERRARRLQE